MTTNRVRVKCSGLAPGLANVRPPGSAKFATPGTDKADKCPAGEGGMGAAGID